MNSPTPASTAGLPIVKVKPGGIANLSGKWSGGGEVKTGKHRGELSLTQATWTREAAPPITAIGGVKYDWPAGFETQGLRVRMNEQTVALEAALAGGLLELRDFLWSDGTTEIAVGTASLPVPADFSKWRDTLANDTRPLSVSINSRVLSLGLLKPWVPGAGETRSALDRQAGHRHFRHLSPSRSSMRSSRPATCARPPSRSCRPPI